MVVVLHVMEPLVDALAATAVVFTFAATVAIAEHPLTEFNIVTV